MFIIGIILGAILSINPYLPAIATHARWVDVLSVLILPLVLIFRFPKQIHALLGLGVIFLLLIPWLLADYSQAAGELAAPLSLRWLEISLFAAAMEMLNSKDRGREGFAVGLMVGSVGNCTLLTLQAMGHTARLLSMGLSYPSSTVFGTGGETRYYGLHGHPNGTAAVISLCVPAAIALNTEFRKAWIYVLGAVAICIPGAVLTSSRSAFLVAGVLLVGWLFQFKSRYKYVVVSACLLASFAILYVVMFTKLGGQRSARIDARWSTDSRTSGNAAERWETTKRSASEALNSPFGLGTDFHELIDPPLYATHNGFTALALAGGLPLALLVLASFANSAFRLRRGGNLPGLLAVQLFGLCLFEEHFNNPTFIAIALWIVLINIGYLWEAMANMHPSLLPLRSVPKR